MCTLCLSDMGELHDEWMRPPVVPAAAPAAADLPHAALRGEPRPARPMTLPMPRLEAWLPAPAATLPDAAHA